MARVVSVVFAVLAAFVGFVGGAAFFSGGIADPIRIVAASTIGMVFGLAAIAFAILAKKE